MSGPGLKRVIIVGGGVTGLAAAYFLRAKARLTLLEEKSSLGGVIATGRAGGFLVEGGPDAFEASRPETANLCRELGIGTVPARPGRRYVLDRGRPRKLSLADGLLSWRGKLRAAMDLVLPRGPGAEDESLGAFVRRRLGREALERVAEPVLSGLFLARADELSLRATGPALLELERAHRSVILGMRRSPVLGPRRAPRDGMSGLVDRLRASMPEVEVRTGAAVRRIEAGRVHLDGEVLEADAVILTVPAPRAAELVEARVPDLAGALRRLRYASSATVSLGFRGRPPFDGTSLFAAGRPLAVVTFPSEKFEGRAPEGHWLVRCFLRGAPADAARIAREELREVLGIAGEPVLERASLWPYARPVYEVGHEARVREIERRTPPGLHLAGSAYRGMSLPDCIRDAHRAANRVLV